MLQADLKDGMKLKTVNGEELSITQRGSTTMVNGASTTQGDIEASNGILHVIDTVLMPSSQ